VGARMWGIRTPCWFLALDSVGAGALACPGLRSSPASAFVPCSSFVILSAAKDLFLILTFCS
jgi:hypothetical protein